MSWQVPPAVPSSTLLLLQQVQEINTQVTWLKHVDDPQTHSFMYLIPTGLVHGGPG